ncbi:MAG: hypothetical protein MOB07_14490 [Acidobacteria bacterium]|nr:hypothetical protein [Acidobacteriota bacterium]
MTSAATRNYAPNQAPPTNPNQPSTSQYGSRSGLDDQVPETTPFYRPPVAYNYGIPEPKKSRTGMWILIALVCFLFIGGGIAAIAVIAIRARQHVASPIEEIGREIETQVYEQIQREIRKAQEQAEQDVRGRQSPHPPLPPGAPEGGMPVGLDKYKYPKAALEHNQSVIGNEFVIMSTGDSVGKVREFYVQLIGQPLAPNKNEEGERVVFHAPGNPPILVVVSQDEDDPEKTRIIILRSSFQIPGLPRRS